MPSYNITLDDASPVIAYTGNWQDARSVADNASYAQGTLHRAADVGANFTLAFHGTGVIVYGARKPSYGTFTATMDGQSSAMFAGSASDAIVYQQPLFSITLSLGQHTLELSDGLFDVDYVVVTEGDGDALTTSTDLTLDDTAPEFSYAPSPTWQADHDTFYPSDTVHRTQNCGASYTLSFSGQAIQLHGAIFHDHGLYSVALDGGAARIFNGSYNQRNMWFATLIYFYGGLADGPHSLTVENIGPSPNSWIDIDYAIASSWPIVQHSPSVTTPSSEHGHNTLGTGPIVGIVLGSTLWLVLCVVGTVLICLRRRQKRPMPSAHSGLLRNLPTSASTDVLLTPEVCVGAQMAHAPAASEVAPSLITQIFRRSIHSDSLESTTKPPTYTP